MGQRMSVGGLSSLRSQSLVVVRRFQRGPDGSHVHVGAPACMPLRMCFCLIHPDTHLVTSIPVRSLDRNCVK
uniref:Uncharacterized protein n=1 Tax=Chromera velia CCMP2878 TaxID=1169474 RepID=A0A0G4I746_9ALVE|eukprot:Cvel_36450.t1-p1 / transcript=Cvel_36450.t1 / gene=Cvel_36450 / organism=Chromera_velia_CCMP2878 / gene_product=hypothetical protein / transcript_product=hypothetical protein / location=Cvel_scaffold7266:68-939(-) / protein_length=71 / sequence_SO=supercontig / SO=protein_coding / is_pseudo=false